MDVLVIALTALSSVGIAVLTYFLWRIARFYESSSDQTAHSWLFLPPLVLLPAGAAWYLILNRDFVGLPSADMLLLGGGATLLLAALLLQQIMMEER
jgi:hypothetical protein